MKRGENMRLIQTKFGPLYVEHFSQRKEKDRIKVFDSNKKYLDYFSIEYLEEHAKINKITPYQQLNKYLSGINNCSDIKNVLNYLGITYEKVSKHWAIIANLLEEITGYEYSSEEQLMGNEWVNKIGECYILICEN